MATLTVMVVSWLELESFPWAQHSCDDVRKVLVTLRAFSGAYCSILYSSKHLLILPLQMARRDHSFLYHFSHLHQWFSFLLLKGLLVPQEVVRLEIRLCQTAYCSHTLRKIWRPTRPNAVPRNQICYYYLILLLGCLKCKKLLEVGQC